MRLNKLVLTVAAIIMVFLFMGRTDVRAAEYLENPIISMVKYEVTNGKIVPGEDFTLKITLKNNSETMAVRNFLVDVDNPTGVAPVYGTASQTYVDEMQPGEERVFSYDYNSWATIGGETSEFHVTVVTDVNRNYIILRIPTGLDAPFSILTTRIPDSVEQGKLATATATFTVLGKENIRDVSLELLVNGETYDKSAIGILTPGTTKTQGVSFNLPQSGEYTAELVLHYENEVGADQSIHAGSGYITITDGSNQTEEGSSNMIDEKDNTNQVMMLGVAGIVVLMCFLGITVLIRKRR